MTKLVRTFIDDDFYICEVNSFMGFHFYKKIRVARLFEPDSIPYEPSGHNSLTILSYMAVALLFMLVFAATGSHHA